MSELLGGSDSFACGVSDSELGEGSVVDVDNAIYTDGGGCAACVAHPLEPETDGEVERPSG